MTERKSAVHPLDAVIKERRKRMIIEQMPIARELARAGIYMQMVDEARLDEVQFRKAAPIFLTHLHDSTYSQLTLECLARIFARKDANRYWHTLAALYRSQPVERPNELGQFAMGLSAALGDSATSKEIPALIELLRDQKLRDRLLLLRPLRLRRRRPEIAAVIDELKSDPEFTKEINSWKPLK